MFTILRAKLARWWLRRKLAQNGLVGADADRLVDYIIATDKRVTVQGGHVVFHPKGGER